MAEPVFDLVKFAQDKSGKPAPAGPASSSEKKTPAPPSAPPTKQADQAAKVEEPAAQPGKVSEGDTKKDDKKADKAGKKNKPAKGKQDKQKPKDKPQGASTGSEQNHVEDDSGESKKKKGTPITLARDWAKAYLIPAPAHLIPKWEAQTHFKFAPTETGVMGDNSHGLMAAYRQAATVYAIATLLERGHKSIDVLFYAQRDISIARNCEAFIKRRSEETVTFNFVGDQVTIGDLNKRFPTGHFATGTACLAVDVYHDNIMSSTKPMDIHTFARYGYTDSIWVGHVFNGRFGTLDTSAWMRDDENMITWYADSVNLAYPRHPACDSLVTPTATGTYASTVLHTHSLGDKVVFRTMLITQSSIACAPQQADHTRSMWIQTEIPDYSAMPAMYRLLPGFLRKMIPVGNIRLWVKTSHMVALRADLAAKGRSHYTFANFQSTVKRVLDEDLEFLTLEKSFPNELNGYRHVLACVMFAHDAKYDADVLTATGDAAGEHLSAYDAARRNIAAPIDPVEGHKLVAVGGWVIAALAVYCMVRYLRTRPANMVSAMKQAACDMIEKKADNFLLVEGKWEHITNTTVQDADGTWRTLLLLWASRPGPANAKLVTRITRLMQSIKDRMANQLPHRQLARALHSAVDKAANAAEYPTMNLKAAAATVAGAASAPFTFEGVGNIVAAPLVEEGVKHIFDNWVWKFVTSSAIAAGDMCQYRAGAPAYLYAWHFGFHYVTAALPLQYALVLHMGYNTIAQVLGVPKMAAPSPITFGLAALGSAIEAVSLVSDFDRHHYQMKTEPGPLPFQEPFLGDLGVEQAFVPAMDARPVVPPELDDNTYMTKVPHTVNIAKESDQGYYRAIYHNAPMFKPAKSQFNMTCVALYRLRKKVASPIPYAWDSAYHAFNRTPYYIGAMFQTGAMPCIKPYYRNASVPEFMSKAIPLQPVPQASWNAYMHESLDAIFAFSPEEEFELWLNHTDRGKRARYVAARKQVTDSPVTLTDKKLNQVKVNIKTDEVLLKVGARAPEPKNGFIPRPIHAVDPTVVVTIGPAIYRATDDLKLLYNGIPIGHVHEFSVYLKFAAGSTDYELSNWVNDFRHHFGPAILLMVAGDDSLVGVKHSNNSIVWFTGDLTACDQSIGPAALAAEWQVLRDLGVDQKVIDLMVVNAGATMRCGIDDKNTGAVFLTRPLRRNTGSPDTTFGNSVCVGLAWHFMLLEMVHNGTIYTPAVEQIQQQFLRFGLTMKLKINYDTEPGFAPEFLKGWWLRAETMFETFVWTPLPSRLLKVTKTIKDPRLTYKGYGVRTLEDGLKCHLTSVAQGLLPFSQPAHLRKVYEFWITNKPVKDALPTVDEDRYPGRTRPDFREPLTIQERAFYDAVENRYGVQFEQAREFFFTLATVKVGQVFFHPMWEALATDYA